MSAQSKIKKTPGNSKKVSAEGVSSLRRLFLLPSKTWWSRYSKSEIQLILMLVLKKKILLNFDSEKNNFEPQVSLGKKLTAA